MFQMISIVDFERILEPKRLKIHSVEKQSASLFLYFK